MKPIMSKEVNRFTGKLKELMDHARIGKTENIDYIFEHLHPDVSFEVTRYVDYALSLVEETDGINRIEYYLFNGILIQRNYASLFFNRRGDYDLIVKANKKGLIDDLQAFVR